MRATLRRRRFTRTQHPRNLCNECPNRPASRESRRKCARATRGKTVALAPPPMKLRVASLFALSVALPLAVVHVACTSNDEGTPASPDGGGGLDASGSGSGSGSSSGSSSGGGSGSSSGSGSGSSSGGMSGDDGGADAAATPVDRFRSSWPVTHDVPTSADYTIDADAGVVTDKVTTLQWTHDLLQQEQTTYDGGTGPGLVGNQSQTDARALCAGAFVGGFHDWRLPTMTELMTIISFSSSDWNDPQSFLETSYGAEYWADSNTPNLYLVYDDHYHPWTFRAGSGDASIRCVRSPYPVSDTPLPAPAAGRWTVNATTAIDTVTKLEWQRGVSAGAIQYTDAQTYCANLGGSDAGVPAGGAAWRLPTLKEAVTVWSEGDGTAEPSVFGATTAVQYIWVSTKYWGTQSVQYANGNIRIYYDPTASGQKTFYWDAAQDFAQTRCVRSTP